MERRFAERNRRRPTSGSFRRDDDGLERRPQMFQPRKLVEVIVESLWRWLDCAVWQISLGGEVPQSLYMEAEAIKPKPKKNMTAISVPSGSKKKLEFKIIQVNSVLK